MWPVCGRAKAQIEIAIACIAVRARGGPDAQTLERAANCGDYAFYRDAAGDVDNGYIE
jgi:hypothetical protein